MSMIIFKLRSIDRDFQGLQNTYISLLLSSVANEKKSKKRFFRSTKHLKVSHLDTTSELFDAKPFLSSVEKKKVSYENWKPFEFRIKLFWFRAKLWWFHTKSAASQKRCF